MKPITFQKISKQNAKIICPYCKLGTIAQPNNPALRKKTLKHHLKTCAKAPKGCTLKMFYTARMKKEGEVCLGDSTVHREKMIHGIWKKADEQAKDLGHEPLKLFGDKAQACDVICKKCWRVASHSRTWNQTCEEEKAQARPSETLEEVHQEVWQRKALQ